jgi:hypothetical protein
MRVSDFNIQVWRHLQPNTPDSIPGRIRAAISVNGSGVETGDPLTAALTEFNRINHAQRSESSQRAMLENIRDVQERADAVRPIEMQGARTQSFTSTPVVQPPQRTYEQERELIILDIRRQEKRKETQAPEFEHLAREREYAERKAERDHQRWLAQRAIDDAREEKQHQRDMAHLELEQTHKFKTRQLDVRAETEKEKRLTLVLKHTQTMELEESRTRKRVSMGLRGGAPTHIPLPAAAPQPVVPIPVIKVGSTMKEVLRDLLLHVLVSLPATTPPRNIKVPSLNVFGAAIVCAFERKFLDNWQVVDLPALRKDVLEMTEPQFNDMFVRLCAELFGASHAVARVGKFHCTDFFLTEKKKLMQAATVISNLEWHVLKIDPLKRASRIVTRK